MRVSSDRAGEKTGAAVVERQIDSIGDAPTKGGQIGGSGPAKRSESAGVEGRYQRLRLLGKGGMGVVYLALDTLLNRHVAIKRLADGLDGDPLLVKRFLTEAQAVAALNHANIVQVYDYGSDKDGSFVVMEYLPGGSLADRCRFAPLQVEEAISITCQLCAGLTEAHDRGIIHRDIKPENVLFTEGGGPKLADFGLAKDVAGELRITTPDAVMGTFDYMPPEQKRGVREVDHRSDLWSLAAALYKMVTGESPQVIHLNKLPRSLQAVLTRALEPAKSDRFQSAQRPQEGFGAEPVSTSNAGALPSEKPSKPPPAIETHAIYLRIDVKDPEYRRPKGHRLQQQLGRPACCPDRVCSSPGFIEPSGVVAAPCRPSGFAKSTLHQQLRQTPSRVAAT